MRPIGVRTHEVDWSDQHHAGFFFITTDAVCFRRSGVFIDEKGQVVDAMGDHLDVDLHKSLASMISEVEKLYNYPKHACSVLPHPFIGKSGVSMDAWYDMYSRVLETHHVQLVGRCAMMWFV